MNAATSPLERTRDRKLLVVDERGRVSHHRGSDLPAFLREHDLLVANDAATLPASLSGIHVATAGAVEVRLAARRSLSPHAVMVFTAIVFGEGDYRTATERRSPPPPLRAGDRLELGPLRATIVAVHAHPRLIDLRFDHDAAAIYEGLARHARPIQYAYVPEPLALGDTWTSIASRPVAFEAPSAGFILDWSMLGAIRARGARFATLTHAAGISSTGDAVLDRALPLDEPYQIPATTAALVARAKRRGGRVIAIGTTVVRALEHAARARGRIGPGPGIATGRIGRYTTLRVVDAIVSGVHEADTSHYELLRAFQGDRALQRMAAAAESEGYRAHEFGDAVLIARTRRSRRPPVWVISSPERRPYNRSNALRTSTDR